MAAVHLEHMLRAQTKKKKKKMGMWLVLLFRQRPCTMSPGFQLIH